ncbi:hypothetical protein TeGR_g13011 [Tetraparma gracilis]|uniref:O-GlcNAc transferase C-terminal domain-containing protein n=1 Tax=Tetraparma gracilis TaxID=2962635 RepID=A0ABQ6M920_9STRA|nr:hypothetical protein TeGR_g13011 [Tetraparma gracilis]
MSPSTSAGPSGKVVSWIFTDTTSSLPLEVYRTSPHLAKQGMPENSPDEPFLFTTTHYTGAEEVCSLGRSLLSSPRPDLSQLSLYSQLLLKAVSSGQMEEGDKERAGECAREILSAAAPSSLTCADLSLLASLEFSQYDFNAALSHLSLAIDQACTRPSLQDDAAVLRVLLGSPAPNDPVAPTLASSPFLSPASLAPLSLLVSIATSATEDLHILLGTELMSTGLADVSMAHAFPLAESPRDFESLCSGLFSSPPSSARVTFFRLRQCLLYHSPTTLSSVPTSVSLRRSLHAILDEWLAVPVLPTTVEPHVDVGVRHTFLAVYQGFRPEEDRDLYEKFVELNRRLCPVLAARPTLRVRAGGGRIRVGVMFSMLAYRRYAPAQILFWGHPVTSALDEIDYVVAGEGFGAETIGDGFSEQVVQFDTVTTRFSLPQADGGGFSLEGMETYPRLYLCGQSVMKMHPSFDEVLVEVLLGDPGGVVVLLSSVKQAVWQRIVRDRLLRKVRDAGIEESRVVFVPQLDRDKYLNLVCSASANIDPFPFGGGVTILESLSCGVEVATDKERQNVWHLATAWTRAMGGGGEGGGGVAQRAIDIAMASAEPGRREKVKRRAFESLHEQDSVLAEWEQFLVRAAG